MRSWNDYAYPMQSWLLDFNVLGWATCGPRVTMINAEKGT